MTKFGKFTFFKMKFIKFTYLIKIKIKKKLKERLENYENWRVQINFEQILISIFFQLKRILKNGFNEKRILNLILFDENKMNCK